MTISAGRLPVVIALSSPPPSDSHSVELSLLDHLYAKGGFSSSVYDPPQHSYHHHQQQPQQ